MRIILNNINSRPIAFFDSGVGGLTVYEKLKKILPYENYIYFGDTKNMPYGEKSDKQLIKFAADIFDFLNMKNVKAVVMACNTTSSITYDVLKDNYNFEIYPIVQCTAKTIAQMPINRLGVLATKATINSHAYSKYIQQYNPLMEIYEQACPEWVKIVENKLENTPESFGIIKKLLEKMMKNNPEKIVLGCTHYPYLLGILEQIAPREMFIDPAVYFAQNIKKDLERKKLLINQNIKTPVCAGGIRESVNKNETYEKFYVSANAEKFQKAASLFYEVKEVPEIIEL